MLSLKQEEDEEFDCCNSKNQSSSVADADTSLKQKKIVTTRMRMQKKD
jgi:hypothetical protein